LKNNTADVSALENSRLSNVHNHNTATKQRYINFNCCRSALWRMQQ